MTYTFKLARRLALAHIVPAAVLAVAACGDAGSPLGPDVSSPSTPSQPAAPAAAVQVYPQAPTVEVNQSVKFAAFSRTPAGDSLPLAVQWTVSGGSISSDGQFSSTAPGAYTVIAADAGQARADTTQVTVVAPAAPPPATPAGSGNEPAGFTMVTERGFDATAENGWSHTAQSPYFSIVNSGYKGAAPKSGSNVGRITFNAGFQDGMAPAKSSNESFSGKKKIYVSTWLQVSENWHGHSVNSKIGYVWTGEKPKVYFNLVGSGSGALRFKIKTQDMNVAAESGQSNNNLADPVLARGQWHRIEMLLTTNTLDRADGCMEAWINGQKVLDKCGFNFNGSRANATHEGRNNWHKIEWNPIWGGQSSETPSVPSTQHMYMDHLYASGR